MEYLDKLKRWLAGCPGMPPDVMVDFTDGLADRAAVFPKGIRELERRRDIRGGYRVRCQCNFLLYRSFYKEEVDASAADNAAWVLGFQLWVQAQEAAGNLPGFGGSGSRREKVWADEGMYNTMLVGGVGLYCVQLHVQFENRYGG